jgi:hypothetical protein
MRVSGGERVFRDPDARQCAATKKDGSRCLAAAVKDDPRELCLIHGKAADGTLADFQRRGRRGRTEKARRKHGVIPPRLVVQAGDTIAALLDAEIEPGEPDYQYRAWGVLALSVVFKIPPDDRQRILEVVQKARPRLARDPQVERILDVERARAELVALYRAGEIPRYMLPPEVERLLVPEPEASGRPITVEA